MSCAKSSSIAPANATPGAWRRYSSDQLGRGFVQKEYTDDSRAFPSVGLKYESSILGDALA